MRIPKIPKLTKEQAQAMYDRFIKAYSFVQLWTKPRMNDIEFARFKRDNPRWKKCKRLMVSGSVIVSRTDPENPEPTEG